MGQADSVSEDATRLSFAYSPPSREAATAKVFVDPFREVAALSVNGGQAAANGTNECSRMNATASSIPGVRPMNERAQWPQPIRSFKRASMRLAADTRKRIRAGSLNVSARKTFPLIVTTA